MTARCAHSLQYKPHEYMAYVYLVSAVSLAVPFVFHLEQSTHHTGKSGNVRKKKPPHINHNLEHWSSVCAVLFSNLSS